jgi:hypothetical protein
LWKKRPKCDPTHFLSTLIHISYGVKK